jgi:predicted dehydrogenase
MKAAVIGCGLIGRKRAMALSGTTQIVGCFDLVESLSEEFAREFNTRRFSSLEELLSLDEVDFVVIATRHDSLSSISLQALNQNKHVFVEKPGAIDYVELLKVYDLARMKGLMVHVGYNHRYHPAIRKSFQLIQEGFIGETMFMRGRYGHGGRVGYEKEWRADKLKSGGGELIDQGTHLIDLSIGFLGPITVDYAATPNYFWNMPVEDNVFMTLENQEGHISFLHASCTEWKNMFSVEIYGKTGKLEIFGLGGSYGIETLTIHRMLPEMGPPVSESWSFPEPDISWTLELNDFIEDLMTGTTRSDNLQSSLEVLLAIDEIYRRTNR